MYLNVILFLFTVTSSTISSWNLFVFYSILVQRDDEKSKEEKEMLKGQLDYKYTWTIAAQQCNNQEKANPRKFWWGENERSTDNNNWQARLDKSFVPLTKAHSLFALFRKMQFMSVCLWRQNENNFLKRALFHTLLRGCVEGVFENFKLRSIPLKLRGVAKKSRIIRIFQFSQRERKKAEK